MTVSPGPCANRRPKHQDAASEIERQDNAAIAL